MMKKKSNSNSEKMEKQQWRSFSIFVSSTFSDMHAERDYLKFVFDKLEEELKKYKVHLNVVDLRWSVDTTNIEEESEREKKVLAVCKEEIDRCNPFFIAILGDRYGWQPNQNQMQDSTKVLASIDGYSDKVNEKSLTHLEIEYGILQHSPLLSGSIVCFRKLKGEKPDQDHKNKYTDFGRKSDLLNSLKKELISYYKSNNEILENSNVIFNYELTWNKNQNPNQEAKESFDGLEEWGDKVKQAIRSCEKYKDFINPIDELNWVLDEQNIFETFIENHTREFNFIENGAIKNTGLFSGREDISKDLLSFASENNSNKRILFLTGKSGIGKSAILANLYKNLITLTNVLILGHSSNLSHRSQQLNLLLQKWIHRLIKQKENISPAEKDILSKIEDQQLNFSDNFKEFCFLKENFNELIRFHSPSKKIIILIDTIDYMENSEIVNRFSWIDHDVLEMVKIICTSVERTRFKLELYHKKDIIDEKEVPDLNKNEVIQIIESLCKLNHKEDLRSSTIKKILEKKNGNYKVSPLWINMSLSFLLSLNIEDFYKIEKRKEEEKDKREDVVLYDSIEQIINELDPDDEKLFIQLLLKAKSIFGDEFVENVFNYLAISRNGLREKDLRCLVDRKWERFKDDKDDLKKGIWEDLKFAEMRRWFKPFLFQSGYENKWNISHSLIKKALLKNIDENKKPEYHYDIIKYLLREIYNNKKQYDDPFLQSETYHHLYKMNNQSMGIKIFNLFDDIAEEKSKEYIATNFEDENFYQWFYSLIDFIDNKTEVSNEDKESMLCFIFNDLILEYIYKRLFYKGKYKLLLKSLKDLHLKIENFTLRFSKENLHKIMGAFNLSYNLFCVETGITPEEEMMFKIEIDNSDKSVLAFISSFYEILSCAGKQKNPEIALDLFNNAECKLSENIAELKNSDLDKFWQYYYEKKGDFFFNYLLNSQEKNSFYLTVVQDSYLNFNFRSQELATNEIHSADILVRIGRSNQRMGNFFETFFLESDSTIINQIMDYYKKEEQIFKKLYDNSPDNLSFKKEYSNSLSDLARIHEKKNLLDLAEEYHLKNILIYENIISNEETIPQDLLYQCFAYENFATFCLTHQMIGKSVKAFHDLINFIEENRRKGHMSEELIQMEKDAKAILNKMNTDF